MFDTHDRSSDEVLKMMIDILLNYIEELFEYKLRAGEEMQYGERLAYTEWLEMIQTWKYASIYGLGFDIEKRYPL